MLMQAHMIFCNNFVQSVTIQQIKNSGIKKNEVI